MSKKACATTVGGVIKQQMAKGRPQKQAVAIALSERKGKIKKGK
jgi:hypothetical protein